MDEKENLKSKIMKKETMVPALIGLVTGMVIMCIVAFSLDYFAKSSGIAKLKHGEEVIATIDGKAITTQDVYNKLKQLNGLDYIKNEADKAILDKEYKLTEKEEEHVKEEADGYIASAEAMGTTKEEFLAQSGFEDYEEFIDYIRTSEKVTKYLYDYIENKLEKGAVQKYYDENKEDIETYDSEHILVRITDDVKDEDALALANEIITKLNEGKKFDEVVEEYKDKIVHEKLGYQGKTASLEQSYIDELIALKDGEYSKTPIKTTYGYHIVHRLSTATIEELRGTIIEILSEDLFKADSNITKKAMVELRKKYDLAIFDKDINKEYEEECNKLYKEKEDK